MPQGKGTYGSKMGRPPKKKMALGGVTGMSGGMDENKRNSATGMTTMNKGGYVSRAKYGQVNNLKKKKSKS